MQAFAFELQACLSRRAAFAQPADGLEQQIAGIITESQFHDPCVAKCIEKVFSSPISRLASAAYHYQLVKNVANAAQVEAFICKTAPTRSIEQTGLTLGLQVLSLAKKCVRTVVKKYIQYMLRNCAGREVLRRCFVAYSGLRPRLTEWMGG
jgi:hypothetical protein